MNIALIGPSGAGKGTHAARLMNEFNFVHVSTGDLLRRHLANHSALGLLARKYMASGELVPDEVVDAMVEESLLSTPPGEGVLFDGFPRTEHQARFLETAAREHQRPLDAVIYLNVSDKIVLERLTGRLICSQCSLPFHLRFKPPLQPNICDHCSGQLYQREDDKPDVARARLRAFHRTTGPLLDYYQSQGRLLLVNSEARLDEVHRAIVLGLRAIRRKEFHPATIEDIKLLRTAGPSILLPEEVGHPSLDLVLIGGPGCGKGTQAEQLCDTFGLPHISTGDLFRENLKNQTVLGKTAKGYMDRGELVPDDITEGMVEERLGRDDTQKGFVLDGFPRTLSQAHALDDMLTAFGRRLSGALYIKVSDWEIISRLSDRRICRNCQTPYHLRFKPPARPGVCDKCGGELYQRDDDNPKTIRARLKTFHAQSEPLLDYYNMRGLLVEVSGEGDVKAVTEKVISAARSLIPKGVELCSKPPS